MPQKRCLFVAPANGPRWRRAMKAETGVFRPAGRRRFGNGCGGVMMGNGNVNGFFFFFGMRPLSTPGYRGIGRVSGSSGSRARQPLFKIHVHMRTGFPRVSQGNTTPFQNPCVHARRFLREPCLRRYRDPRPLGGAPCLLSPRRGWQANSRSCPRSGTGPPAPPPATPERLPGRRGARSAAPACTPPGHPPDQPPSGPRTSSRPGAPAAAGPETPDAGMTGPAPARIYGPGKPGTSSQTSPQGPGRALCRSWASWAVS